MSENPESIRQAVRERYTQVAESSVGCCGPESGTCGCASYDVEELNLLPVEAVASGRGCGNPTAIAELRSGEVVLDLGSGGGLDVLLAARQVGPQGFVYGLDTTPAMIDLARRNAARAGVANVEFRAGELEDIPLADQTVDVIISNCVVNLTPDKSRALLEAFRVLRPGGRLAISDIVIDPDLEGLPFSADAIRRSLDWAGCAAGALTSTELRRALDEAGFRDVRLDVEYRMTPEELPRQTSDLAAALGGDGLRQVAGRFTSTSITARRPA
jgi:ubiquinone/menaquinone biosynthesis C-methylase UbiE